MAQYLTALADVLRSAGLVVVELAGWERRGRSNNSMYADGKPWCVMVHHTASAGDGWADAEYCTYGSPDAPVTNLVIGGDAVVYVCAAGPTNTNGKGYAIAFSKGTVPNDSMNTYAVGIELSNNGVGMQYGQPQVDACIAACNAITAAYGLDPGDVATHNEWAPDRKIDPATAAAVQGPWRPASSTTSGTWDLYDLRAECRRRAGTTPPSEDDMTPEQDFMLKEIYARLFGVTRPPAPGEDPAMTRLLDRADGDYIVKLIEQDQ